MFWPYLKATTGIQAWLFNFPEVLCLFQICNLHSEEMCFKLTGIHEQLRLRSSSEVWHHGDVAAGVEFLRGVKGPRRARQVARNDACHSLSEFELSKSGFMSGNPSWVRSVRGTRLETSFKKHDLYLNLVAQFCASVFHPLQRLHTVSN